MSTMRVLAVYDQSGRVLSQSTAGTQPEGIPSKWVEVPEGKSLIKMDTSQDPHQPVFIDIFDAVKEINQLKQSIAELTILVTMPQMNGGENQ